MVRQLPNHGELRQCACGATYPAIDGIPMVFRELDAWLASEGAEVLRRTDLGEAGAFLAESSGGALRRNSSLVAVYQRSREGALQDWLRARVGGLAGSILELGAGLGCGRSDTTALDANFALLRHHPSTNKVCADAGDPPFIGGVFSAVVLANLLDSVADPALVLAQADGLLKPGGILVVTCAFAFQDDITPRAARFSPADLLGGLRGEHPFGGYPFQYSLDEVVDRIEWPLWLSDRTRHVHDVLAIVARKAG